MALNTGTIVTAPVRPKYDTDVYPTVIANEIKGGYQTTGSITSRNNITPARREVGMLVYVVSEDKYYQLRNGITNAHWVEDLNSSSGGGGGASTAGDVSYTNPAYPQYTDVQDVLDALLYTQISASFSNTAPQYEKGQTCNSVTLNWSYTKTPISQTINQTIGALNTALRTYNYTTPFTNTTTFTLTYADEKTTGLTKSTSVIFGQKRYIGVSLDETLTNAKVLELSTQSFAVSKAITFAIDGQSKYIYMVYPKSFGTPSFKVNGFINNAFTVTEMSFTNASGYTDDYYICRTDTIQSGTNILIEIY